jgi:hypothetical protein
MTTLGREIGSAGILLVTYLERARCRGAGYPLGVAPGDVTTTGYAGHPVRLDRNPGGGGAGHRRSHAAQQADTGPVRAAAGLGVVAAPGRHLGAIEPHDDRARSGDQPPKGGGSALWRGGRGVGARTAGDDGRPGDCGGTAGHGDTRALSRRLRARQYDRGPARCVGHHLAGVWGTGAAGESSRAQAHRAPGLGAGTVGRARS